jgi:hypothetical protein
MLWNWMKAPDPRDVGTLGSPAKPADPSFLPDGMQG